MLIGTVEQIWRYPVKSMAGEKLLECLVGELGIDGDRGWALRDETTGEITNGSRTPLLMQCAGAYLEAPTNESIPNVRITFPDGSTIESADANVNASLSEALGKTVTLWPRELEISQFTSPPGTYFDAFPIHVLTSASLAKMAEHNPSSDWDVRRFRPNFFVRTNNEIAGLPEASWSGRVLRIGTVEIKCEIPTVRCKMATQKQKDVPEDPSVLRAIVKEAEQNLGTYANVIKPGAVAEGDPVELI